MTTAPAPITAPSPILTPDSIVTFAPIKTSLPMKTGKDSIHLSCSEKVYPHCFLVE